MSCSLRLAWNDSSQESSRPISCRGAHLDALQQPLKESRVRRMHARVLLGSDSNVGIRDFVVADSILCWLIKYSEFQGSMAGVGRTVRGQGRNIELSTYHKQGLVLSLDVLSQDVTDFDTEGKPCRMSVLRSFAHDNVECDVLQCP